MERKPGRHPHGKLPRCAEVSLDSIFYLCHAPSALRPFPIVQHLLLAETTEDHFKYLACVQRFVGIAVRVEAVEAGNRHYGDVPFRLSSRAY